ncbi:MAG: hypothetical protein CM15mV13_0130 [uncultured marine virus]|nr:MAG: hypothetical protein CM15mV13_0130 [uncultured marine virus]
MTDQQSLEWDAQTVMEQTIWQNQAYADGCIMFILTSIS